MSELRTLPIYRALHRPNLVLGGERELVLFALVLFAGLALSAMNLVAFVTSALLWFCVIAMLRAMAKADVMMSKIYIKHLKLAAYYAPRSTPFCEA